MLQKLPMEVLELVFAQIHDRRDLKSLCEVSKSLYDRAALYLYSSGQARVCILLRHHDARCRYGRCCNPRKSPGCRGISTSTFKDQLFDIVICDASFLRTH